MRLDDSRESRNVEDRRGRGGGGRMVVGGGIGSVVLVLVALFLGVDPTLLLQGGAVEPARQEQARPLTEKEAAQRRFVARVLGETEDVWREAFQRSGRVYRDPTLVLFSGEVRSGCGDAPAAVGPFYCPADSRIYIDLDFLGDLQRRLGAPGDFAAAYIIAHEVGHHVQNLLGVLDRADQARRGASAADGNRMQVRVELMADCLAGIWARRADTARGILEAGDLEEALGAAAAVGDDRLQRRSGGQVVPDSFTHGSSAQRVRWFSAGFERGELADCDTFAAARP